MLAEAASEASALVRWRWLPGRGHGGTSAFLFLGGLAGGGSRLWPFDYGKNEKAAAAPAGFLVAGRASDVGGFGSCDGFDFGFGGLASGPR